VRIELILALDSDRYLGSLRVILAKKASTIILVNQAWIASKESLLRWNVWELVIELLLVSSKGLSHRSMNDMLSREVVLGTSVWLNLVPVVGWSLLSSSQICIRLQVLSGTSFILSIHFHAHLIEVLVSHLPQLMFEDLQLT
jgi:hypothetical protein